MLQARTVRALTLAAAATGGPAHLSAASGLVRLGDHLAVVADDELHLGLFDPSGHDPGRVVRLFDGGLPAAHEARKAAKPDCEALLVLPPFGGCGRGALMAMGSGSGPARHDRTADRHRRRRSRAAGAAAGSGVGAGLNGGG